jgi:hypothetical protein
MKNRRTGVYPPTVRKRDKYESTAPQKKIYLHPDQVFWIDAIGDVQDCFRYCYSHDSISKNPGQNKGMFLDAGYIAIELGRKASIIRINHSQTDGQIRVFVGDDFDSLKHRFVIMPGESYCDTLEEVAPYGKIIVLSGSNCTIPFIEFVTEKAIKPMRNTGYQHTHTNPYDLVKIIDPVREKAQDMALVQKSVVKKQVVIVSEKKVLTEGNKVRLSPTMVNGTPVSYDETIMACSKMGENPDILVKANNPNLAAFLLARYGKNKNHRYNKAKDAYYIDQEFKYVNNMGMEFQNKNKVGMGLANSIGIWPKERIDNPDKYCQAMDQLTEACKTVDITTPVASIPMKPDRSIYYFVYRHYRKFWADKLRIEIKTVDEAKMLQRFLDTVHHYTPNLDIELIVNFRLEPAKWMSCLCFAGYHRISAVILTNYEDLFNKVAQKWETIFEPNEKFEGLIDWIETIKSLNLTLYEPGPVVDRAIYKQTVVYEHIEQFMLNWLSSEEEAIVFEKSLKMPRTYQIK